MNATQTLADTRWKITPAGRAHQRRRFHEAGADFIAGLYDDKPKPKARRPRNLIAFPSAGRRAAR